MESNRVCWPSAALFSGILLASTLFLLLGCGGNANVGGSSSATTPEAVSITGTNFVPGVVATMNGSPRTTTYVSDTQLTVVLPPTDLTAAGTLLMNVTNPQPGGGASGTAPFTVTNPAPTVTALAPSTLQ